MNTTIIKIKTIKATGLNQCIVITSNGAGNTLFSYYNGYEETSRKNTFNKNAMVEFLIGCNIPKKYIKQLEGTN